MDTHIKNGPIDAYRSLFIRLKGRTIPQQRRCSSISEKKQTNHQTKHPERSINLLDKNHGKQKMLSVASKKDARCTSNNLIERYNRGR